MNFHCNWAPNATVAVILALLLAGCSHPPASSPPKAGLSTLIVTNETALAVSSFKLVTKHAANGQMPTDVAVSLNMSSMMMPPNVVKLRPVAPGVFVGSGTFTMGGGWIAKATGQIGGKTVVLGNFPISVKD